MMMFCYNTTAVLLFDGFRFTDANVIVFTVFYDGRTIYLHDIIILCVINYYLIGLSSAATPETAAR